MKEKRAEEIYTLDHLRDWRAVTRDVGPPIRLGVLGDPVVHSHSPPMQNAALSHCQIETQYARFQISSAELEEALTLVCELDFVGVNLTVPHKIAALSFVDEVDENAKRIGALNTVLVQKKKLIGFNTDGLGFSRAIREVFSVDLRDLGVLLLGAGGAGRAIATQCARENCERLVIANRTFKKAQALSDELREFFVGPRVLGPVPRLQAIKWEEAAFRSQVAHVDLVVNATLLGLKRTDPPTIPSYLLAPHLMVYDTVYSDGRTQLESAAIEAGARAANGTAMLLHQGALAFEIWFGHDAPIGVMREALRRP